ncbi:MAG: NAD(P)/FAD-dependent oxidoreductase [Acidimicrobiaceae bacterium]|jgi:cation diffusion facilitator CzcD-associated flavoprotein CzcO|nr:NAD(P)/FAD-dependent oxidoreductase [Acidimicrobiaceae bacterium]MBT5580146.1 NAD(P)/FAD-dependent oxidoreductase [Acidimicrobiaceae bacterium]MBT5852073.1 NAD(P)/FAD-dependent oxidoreductase [Acidimicrobiaceae bacterium]
MNAQIDTDVVIVGAGFAGLYMLHSVRGLGLSARVIEAADDVGGTWYWNRYPGARCDVPSMEYSYGWDDELQQEWEWTERYATQPEILSYVEHVTARFDLRKDITFETRVTASRFDESTDTWTVKTDADEQIRCRFVVLATGCLSSTNLPEFDGRDDFAGRSFHTGQWPHEKVDFTDRRVVVIGTGSSAIQSIPQIAAEAGHVTVMQRTPNYTIPARNQSLDPKEVKEIKANYRTWRAKARDATAAFGGHRPRVDVSAKAISDEERLERFEDRWALGGLGFGGVFNDLMLDPESNALAADFFRSKVAEIVEDPELSEKLSPDTVFGCKRMCVDTDYLATYNRPNVSLVDVSETPIERITAAGVVADGVEYEADDIVYATGFDAMTGTIERIDIVGRGGLSLRDKWSAGPLTYLGLGVESFPNLFLITGPGSPSVLTNMIASIEQHVEWIRDLIGSMTDQGLSTVEADGESEAKWVDYVNAVAGLTLFNNCSSWYLGANVPGKPRVFMPLIGFPDYKVKCDEVAAAGYDGWVLN